MDLKEWHRQLNGASGVNDALQVINDFVESLDPQQVQMLPPECRPSRMSDPEEVSGYTVDLLRSRARGDNEVLATTTTFFAAATYRITQLLISAKQGTRVHA